MSGSSVVSDSGNWGTLNIAVRTCILFLLALAFAVLFELWLRSLVFTLLVVRCAQSPTTQPPAAIWGRLSAASDGRLWLFGGGEAGPLSTFGDSVFMFSPTTRMWTCALRLRSLSLYLRVTAYLLCFNGGRNLSLDFAPLVFGWFAFACRDAGINIDDHSKLRHTRRFRSQQRLAE